MMNLLLDELKLIEQIRNISDYENKSKEDLMESPSKSKPKPEPKPEPEPEPKPKPELKIRK